MRFQASSDFKNVFRSVPKSPTHPILGCFKITTTETTMRVVGYNLSSAVVATIEIKDGVESAFCVNAKRFVDIISMCEGEIELKVNEESIAIVSGKSKYSLPLMDVNEYPDIDNVEGVEFNCDNIELTSTLKRVLPFISPDDTKQVLCSARVTVGDEYIEIAATDGHKLIVDRLPLQSKPEANCSFNLPRHTIPLLPSVDSVVTITVNESLVKFEFGNTVVISRLIEGSYPAYNQLIPNSQKAISFENSKVLDSLEKVSLTLDDKTPLVDLSFDELLKVSSTSAHGSSEAHVELEQTEKIDVVFNHRYLLQTLNSFPETNQVTMNFLTPHAPFVFKSQDLETLVLIMPVQRVN